MHKIRLIFLVPLSRAARRSRDPHVKIRAIWQAQCVQEQTDRQVPENLAKYGWLSLVVGTIVFGMKLGAWWITGSVGLLSDAMESSVNIVAAIVALLALRAASKPPDSRHHFGHGKAEYLSALVEGTMIVVAAILILVAAVDRLFNPEPVTELGIGLAISVLAAVFNGVLAVVLLRAGKKHRAIVLTADGQHILTDVWTTAGVVLGVALVGLTGWNALDSLIAMAVAVNIVIAGAILIRNSTSGLLDSALPPEDHEAIRTVLRKYTSDDVHFHAIQTRRSGRQRFVAMHVLVPGSWSIQQGHDLLENVESDLRAALSDLTVHTHLEPIEDPRSWSDQPPGGLQLD